MARKSSVYELREGCEQKPPEPSVRPSPLRDNLWPRTPSETLRLGPRSQPGHVVDCARHARLANSRKCRNVFSSTAFRHLTGSTRLRCCEEILWPAKPTSSLNATS